MNQFKTWLLLFCTLSTYTYANSEQLSLNGSWHFSNTAYDNTQTLLAENYADWDTLTVPGNWDTQKKYADFSGKGYYQKSFTPPKHWKHKNIRLKFSAVYQTAKVWLNGQLLGQHVGGYTPFEFDISQHLSFDKNNSLVVMADNTYHRGAWWAWGGISRDVDLIAEQDIRIVYQHITSEPDFERQNIKFTIKYKLQNYTDQPQNQTIYSEILDNQQQKKNLTLQVKIPAKQFITKSTTFVEKLTSYQLWDLQQPKLYTLQSRLNKNQNTIDIQEDNFGIRKFEVKGEQFFLNNQAVRLNGVNRVHDHPDFGNTEPDELVLKDLQDIKSLGANFSRLMHAPISENLLALADRLGYLIIGEIPVWGDDDPQSFANNPLTKTWLNEMVERDFNHPSIVGWSVGNELRDPLPEWGKKTLTPDQYAYVDSMLDHLAQIDPSRLKTYVSITAYSSEANLSNEPYEKLDFISVNSYGDAVKNVENTHKNFAGKPIFLSEVGLKQIGGSAESKLDKKLVNYLKTLKDYPYLTGFSIWSYNDYRSDYKGTPESGFREWGVVDEYRNKKAAYYQLQDIFKYWQEK
ncbi:glycoside hydrolase family 2 protein [Paraglaciecola sp. L3A3]|uniref:glycoside hydrolase family 2 protein n=1 Tax=Paraglaciecola sp. L3A3 TaxID=2686358 RepID=UPI00131D5E38|nr:glycoside hydrolase family 2 TIM barrel-domain containing protein [Paraglaciecola sp. L3A3]